MGLASVHCCVDCLLGLCVLAGLPSLCCCAACGRPRQSAYGGLLMGRQPELRSPTRVPEAAWAGSVAISGALTGSA